MVDLENYSPDALETLSGFRREFRQARVLHGDPHPRNMTVCGDRILWVDFDSAQTLPEDAVLTPRQEMWFREELALMDEFVNGMFY